MRGCPALTDIDRLGWGAAVKRLGGVAATAAAAHLVITEQARIIFLWLDDVIIKQSTRKAKQVGKALHCGAGKVQEQ